MRQTWDRLLFAHWPVHFDMLRPLVPAALELDRYDGEAWLGVVPFLMRNVRPRALPAVPWLSAFPELNVRTYVTVGEQSWRLFLQPGRGKSARRRDRAALVPSALLPRALLSQPGG